MSSVDEEIAFYRAEIAEIKAGRGIYADATDKEKRDAIHDCRNAFNTLLQSQQGMFLMVIMLCFHTTILICLCVLFALY